MTKQGTTMPRVEGAGIVAGRKRRRRIVAIAAVLAVIGGLGGFAVGFFDHPDSAVPAPVAVAGAVLITAALTMGSVLYFRAVDELERSANYWSSTIGLYAYILAYLDWFLLWRAGMVGEPSHAILFAFTVLVSASAYLWRKFRPGN